ncbi:MAG: methylase [unclassified Hahellaceae]|nr:methylase [Hahellaceae bacterium]|tara:strand:+ start:75445 stop:76062 length:618 start_codon:yes stop_codon:yes gene_type:complete
MDDLPCSEASERNKRPILDVLASLLSDRPQRTFEIGSGTGQHATFFAAAHPQWAWQPSEQPPNLDILKQRYQRSELQNILPPISFEVGESMVTPGLHDAWDLVFTANTLHIMLPDRLPFFFNNANSLLKPQGLLVCYGPFMEQGEHNSVSNREFDAALKTQGCGGIPDISQLEMLAEANDLRFQQQIEMPANNRILVFQKIASFN